MLLSAEYNSLCDRDLTKSDHGIVIRGSYSFCIIYHLIIAADHDENLPNGDTNGDVDEDKPKKQDIVLITGRKENCDNAKDALLVSYKISF